MQNDNSEVTRTRRTRTVMQPGREVSTDDFSVGQQADIDMDNRSSEIIEAVDGDDLHNGYADALAFNEEPVTIAIQQANVMVDFPPTHVPVAVNGKGAEVLTNGRWVPMGWLPIGEPITTKRKYFEALLRSKQATVNTVVTRPDGKDSINRLRRTNDVKYPVTVIADRNPKGMQWMMQVLAEA